MIVSAKKSACVCSHWSVVNKIEASAAATTFALSWQRVRLRLGFDYSILRMEDDVANLSRKNKHKMHAFMLLFEFAPATKGSSSSNLLTFAFFVSLLKVILVRPPLLGSI